MARSIVLISIFLSLLASPSLASQSPEAEAMQKKMAAMAIAGKKQVAAAQAYATALEAYETQRANTPEGSENTLFQSYHDLVVKYTLAMTNFWLRQDGDKNLPLPVLGAATGTVTLDKVKNDYKVAIQEYIAGLNIYDQNLAFNLPTDPPPIPPMNRGDRDFANYVQTEKEAGALRQASINKLLSARAKLIASMPIYTNPGGGSGQSSNDDKPGLGGCPPGETPFTGVNVTTITCAPY
ncbi:MULTISPECIES: hypothetical protein [Paraburkholderia]|uniref:Uncharacterized protein n=1 Tax=Paraburkholderia acidicola TaxID=1912599 RepID=A0ABV1LYM5_9BURK